MKLIPLTLIACVVAVTGAIQSQAIPAASAAAATTPRITPLAGTAGPFNPHAGKHTWRFSTGERARITVDIRRSGQSGPILVRNLGTLPAGAHSFTWNGKTGLGSISARDWHWFHVTAVNPAGKSANRAFGGVWVVPDPRKRIGISLSQQKLFAYVGNTVVMSTLVSTGNQALTPTPAGHYTIYSRYHPYQFISPWPLGHPYYYEPAWSSYAFEFIGGGYFIHDAPWRNVFGPASQAGGPPGTDYGGTHGCVNVPLSAAQFVNNWAPNGTPVDVRW